MVQNLSRRALNGALAASILLLASLSGITPAAAQSGGEIWEPVSRTVSHLTGPGGEILTCTIEATQRDGVEVLRSVVSYSRAAAQFTLGEGRRCLAETEGAYVAFDAHGNIYFSYMQQGIGGHGLMSISATGQIRWVNEYGLNWPLEITIGGDGLLYAAMHQVDIAGVIDPATGDLLTNGFQTANFGDFSRGLVVPTTTGAAIADSSGPRYLDYDSNAQSLEVVSWPSSSHFSVGSFGPEDSYVEVSNRPTPNGTALLCNQEVRRYGRSDGLRWSTVIAAPYDQACGVWFGEATPDGGFVGYTARRDELSPFTVSWFFFRVSPDGEVTHSTTYDPQDNGATEPGVLRTVDTIGNLITLRGRQRFCEANGSLVRCDIIRALAFDAQGQLSESDVDPPDPITFSPEGLVLTPGLLTLGGRDLNHAEATSTPATRTLAISALGDDYSNARYYQLVGRATPPPPPPNQIIDYVALGDSFSSGEGTYQYNDSRCHRGPLAWPSLLEPVLADLSLIVNNACSGASTQHILTTRYKGHPPQLPTEPQPEIDLVTITIGGNDVGFGRILAGCFLSECLSRIGPTSWQRFVRDLENLATILDAELYPALGSAYPNARILHVGYPLLFPSFPEEITNCAWLSRQEQRQLTRAGVELARAIKDATDEHPRVEFVNTLGILDNHELCTVDSWVNPIVGPVQAYGSEQGHPNDMGQEAYRDAIIAAIE